MGASVTRAIGTNGSRLDLPLVGLTAARWRLQWLPKRVGEPVPPDMLQAPHGHPGPRHSSPIAPTRTVRPVRPAGHGIIKLGRQRQRRRSSPEPLPAGARPTAAVGGCCA
jgi:hypothetical protein